MFVTKTVKNEISSTTEKRILGKTVGKELTVEEQKFIAGGDNAHGPTWNHLPENSSDRILPS
ncbi:hypothetical protein ACO0LF_15815 [Undibacterium sp. Di27W]|uniref:hypothetical protein n=1 Tax=Undibacterium sp. Di27W TaxID=3413036 RepID=UPI003BF10E79